MSDFRPRLTGQADSRTAATVALKRSPASPRSAATEATSSEGELVRRLQAGDPAAFAELVASHGPRMLVVIRRYLPVEADAEDALQDAFLSVWRSMATFTGGSRLATWLHRIAVNAALMRIRARSRRPEVQSGEPEVADRSDAGVRMMSTMGVGELLARTEVRQRIQGCLAELPETIRTVVRLRDIDGLDLHEIGLLLDVCQTTVKTRLHRGRKALRARLAEWLGDVA